MNILYKYAAYLGLAAVLVAAGGATGWHLGGLSSAEKLAQYQAASATALEQAKTAASAAQSKADQQAIAQAKAMATQANQAVIDQQAATNRLQTSLEQTKATLMVLSKSSKNKNWLTEPIPYDILQRMCWVIGAKPNENCIKQ